MGISAVIIITRGLQFAWLALRRKTMIWTSPMRPSSTADRIFCVGFSTSAGTEHHGSTRTGHCATNLFGSSPGPRVRHVERVRVPVRPRTLLLREPIASSALLRYSGPSREEARIERLRQEARQSVPPTQPVDEVLNW